MSKSHPFLRELGERVRELRVAAGLSTAELARAAGMSRRYATEVEAGRANPSLTKLHDLALALDVGVPQLLGPGAASARLGRVALVGLRGAGKSTVGRELALRREVPFIELDERIEGLAGLSLGAIFELHGEAWFHELEAEALEKVLSEGEDSVIAVGGSIVSAPATFARLRQTCHTVWLRARPEDHFDRVLAQGDRRPMQGRPRSMEELKGLLAAREAAYERCAWTLDTSRLSVDEVCATLLERLAG